MCKDPKITGISQLQYSNLLRHGDGVCDDDNNYLACNFDGGDCCLPFVNKTRCTICICLDPKSKNYCSPLKWLYLKSLGDRFCDVDFNIPGCNYDLGDCCGDEKNGYTKECYRLTGIERHYCECIDPASINYRPECLWIVEDIQFWLYE